MTQNPKNIIDRQTDLDNQVQHYYEDDEIDLLDLLIVLAKHKRLILGLTTLFAVISIVYVLMATPIYRATTRIMPPTSDSQGQLSSLVSQSGIPGFAANALGIKTPGDLYVGLIESRTIKDGMIKRFGLMGKYKAENMDMARITLSDITTANTDAKSGLINISVEDKDPSFAAELANGYVLELQKLLDGIAVGNAAQQRLFLEKQVKETQEKMISAENSLAEYQKKTGILNANQQASSLMSAIATFRARISAKEVEIKAAKTYASSDNPRIQKLRAEITGLREQLGNLEAQATSGENSYNIKELPDAGMDYLRRLRDQKFYETLYNMLLRQFEQAKMAEAQNPTIIQVIDKAVPPLIKAKPKRKRVVVLATVLGFFLSIFLSFVSEFFSKALENPERKEKLGHLLALIYTKKRKVQ